MSTRCQIEFRSGNMRRTVYRHSDGYPSAVVEDLLAFLAWSVRGSDVEYVAANFLYWSKRELDEPQLGFGICTNDELHGDVEYYYVVRYEGGACTVSAHEVEREDGVARVGKLVAVAPAPFSFSPRYAPPLPLQSEYKSKCLYMPKPVESLGDTYDTRAFIQSATGMVGPS